MYYFSMGVVFFVVILPAIEQLKPSNYGAERKRGDQFCLRGRQSKAYAFLENSDPSNKCMTFLPTPARVKCM